LLARAYGLERLTVGWMLVEATVALWSGIAAHSITLIAFGADSVIELISAFVLIWRLDVEVRRGAEFSPAAEERARKIGGILLCALALYVVLSAAWSLWTRTGETFSPAGLVVALVAIPAMYALANAKIRVADKLSSRAMRADAAESLTCGYLSAVVVVGLLADFFFRAWWVDAATSLAIVFFLLKEAREAWSGEDCCAA
ncbi:MAG: cation transporter, partial [Candidatus Velthaea sp.]